MEEEYDFDDRTNHLFIINAKQKNGLRNSTNIPINLVQKVTIDERINKLPEEYFYGFEALEEVILSPNITHIGNSCFQNCTALVSIDIGDTRHIQTTPNRSIRDIYNRSICHIGKNCFRNCVSLQHVRIRGNIKRLDELCFKDCVSLQFIEIDNGVMFLDKYCFSGCSRIVHIDIPKSIYFLGSNCFEDCNSLQSIDLKDGLKKIESFCFKNCISLERIEIPNTVTFLRMNAFSECNIHKLVIILYKNYPNEEAYEKYERHYIKSINFKKYGKLGLTDVYLPSSKQPRSPSIINTTELEFIIPFITFGGDKYELVNWINYPQDTGLNIILADNYPNVFDDPNDILFIMPGREDPIEPINIYQYIQSIGRREYGIGDEITIVFRTKDETDEALELFKNKKFLVEAISTLPNVSVDKVMKMLKTKKRENNEVLWCNHPDCLESTNGYRTQQNLNNHHNRNHGGTKGGGFRKKKKSIKKRSKKK